MFHLLGVFLTDEKSKNQTAQQYLSDMMHKPWPTDDDLRGLIDAVHSLDGLVSVNHLPWSTSRPSVIPGDTFRSPGPTLPQGPSRQDWLTWGADFIEVVNGDTLDLPSLQFISEHKEMKALTGSDFHVPLLAGARAWTVLKVNNFTAKDLMDALRAGETSFIFDPTGSMAYMKQEDIDSIPPAPRNLIYDFMAPWYGLGEYVGLFYDRRFGMPSFQGPQCKDDELTVNYRRIGFFFVHAFMVWIVLELICGLFLLIVRKKSGRQRQYSSLDSDSERSSDQ
jgi:hypothetical protein